MIRLTAEQQQELATSGMGPVHALDPTTQAEYVLVPVEVYQKWSELAAGDLEPSDAYAAIDRSFAEGWNDPKMDDYDRYEDLKK